MKHGPIQPSNIIKRGSFISPRIFEARKMIFLHIQLMMFASQVFTLILKKNLRTNDFLLKPWPVMLSFCGRNKVECLSLSVHLAFLSLFLSFSV